MSAKNFRFILVGFIVGAFIIGGAVGYFGVTFLGQKVKEVDHVKIEAEVNEDARVSAEQTELRFEDARIERLHDYLAKIIPEPAYQDQIVADVKKYADDSDVPLKSLVFTDGVGGQGVAAPKIEGARPVSVALTLGSDIPYKNFIKFVEKLENNLQHIQVLSLDMQPSPTDPRLLTSAGLSIAVYVEK